MKKSECLELIAPEFEVGDVVEVIDVTTEYPPGMGPGSKTLSNGSPRWSLYMGWRGVVKEIYAETAWMDVGHCLVPEYREAGMTHGVHGVPKVCLKVIEKRSEREVKETDAYMDNARLAFEISEVMMKLFPATKEAR